MSDNYMLYCCLVAGVLEENEVILSAALSGHKTCKMDNIVLLDGAKLRLTDRHW